MYCSFVLCRPYKIDSDLKYKKIGNILFHLARPHLNHLGDCLEVREWCLHLRERTLEVRPACVFLLMRTEITIRVFILYPSANI